MLSSLPSSAVTGRAILGALAIANLQACAVDAADDASSSDPNAPAALYAPAVTPEPSAPAIASITAAGGGCPEGTWRADFSADRETVVVHFEGFSVASTNATRRSSDCKLTLNVTGEDGVSYAPTGHAIQLASTPKRDASFALETTAYWETSPDKKVTSASAYKSERGLERFSTGAVFDERSWSPCSGDHKLHVDTNLTLDEAASSRGVTVTYEHLAAVSFRARRCPAAPPPVDGSTTTTEPDAPDPVASSAGITIADARVIGAKCKDAAVTLSPDGTNLTVAFDGTFSTELATSSLSNENCTLTIQPQLPPGKTYALESMRLEGTVALEEGADALVRSGPAFIGIGSPSVPGTTLAYGKSTWMVGPRSGEFVVDHKYTGSDLFFAPCGANRPFQARLGVSLDRNGSQAKGAVSVTKAGAFKFVVKDCK